MSDYLKSILLGVVEGLTEFIPVSSTGHLILFGDFLEFTNANSGSFEIFIQLGAILAVVILYRERFKSFFLFDSQAKGLNGLEGIKKLFVASLPAFVLGFLFHDFIKLYLFNPLSVAIALVLGGVFLILIERKDFQARIKSLDQISYQECLFLGFFQCLALWPGISRSGATIIGGLLRGFDRGVAAEFSFFMAVPVLAAAASYDLLKSWDKLSNNDLYIFCLGFIVSFIFALFAIKTFISILKKHTFKAFGWYRIILGLIVIFLLAK